MSNNVQKINSELDELDLVSAICILASNDENNLMTYRYIGYRFGLVESFDVKALILSRPELFRPGANPNHLEAWKSETLLGKRLPSWIKAIDLPDKREFAIKNLSTEDVFRSQFRTERNAKRSEIEIIKWGLEHLDRLRKARAEASDASVKRWQMWLIFWASLAGIVSQFGIAYAKYKNWI